MIPPVILIKSPWFSTFSIPWNVSGYISLTHYVYIKLYIYKKIFPFFSNPPQSFIQHRTRYTSRTNSFRSGGPSQRVIADADYKNISSILEGAASSTGPGGFNQPVYGRHGYEVGGGPRNDSAASAGDRRAISGSSSAKLGWLFLMLNYLN